MTHPRPAPYLITAAISDPHLQQPRDWPQIAALYHTLARQTRSPIVEMNRAIAVADSDEPEAGLAILDRLDLDHYRHLHSTRTELLRRAGRHCADRQYGNIGRADLANGGPVNAADSTPVSWESVRQARTNRCALGGHRTTDEVTSLQVPPRTGPVPSGNPQRQPFA